MKDWLKLPVCTLLAIICAILMTVFIYLLFRIGIDIEYQKLINEQLKNDIFCQTNFPAQYDPGP
jgi:hypothetical protein